MKTAMRIIAVVLVIATMMLMSVVAFAANTANTEFANFVVNEDSERSIPPREKTDTSSHYFTFTTGTPATVKVVSYGTSTNTYVGGENLTYSNGQTVAYVVCRRGTQYNIHNLVYEQGYRWARLAITSWWDYDAGPITGKWSPDSSGTYISARP